ncbi:hypothetical protein [Pelagicoccus sp. SDUM812005]|uniref:hypothetical protein n=1 Tax=Pelagicoccus sp. SDUM812005 TaxID=3041257 RepID=UPI00280F8B18|nr:hypothetical protein [Pelagicoccus sp. SDUM812005]MDQ8181139.1 hypothetical protein [Pelagicoccus sp. SDUM812005]
MRYFNVPAGWAVDTLKEVSEQGESQFLYIERMLERVRTKKVHGHYSLREVLDRMLEDTQIEAVRDSVTGAYYIRKRTAEILANEGSPKGREGGMNTIQTKDMMTLKTKLRKLGKYILPPFVAASSLVAQDNEDSDVFELSPFTVDAGDEAGYRATSTLAGSRLNMRLKDVGSAISVMTKELMNDVGATDAGTLLSYGLNTEVASGDQGNFSNSIRSNGSYSSQETRRNPQSGQRIRGLAEATLTRDYFLTDIPFDG